MSEARIVDAALPELTIDELFTAQGADYSKRPPRPGIVDMNLRLLEEAKKLVRPRVIWQEVRVIGAREQELELEDGLILKGKLLPKVAGTADSLVLFAMTIGSGLDQRVAECSRAGQTMEAFVLDSVGSALMAKVAMIVLSDMERTFKAQGLSTTFPLGPGHSYWTSLEDVGTIINFLKGGQIGISLSASNLMLPKKSIAMVMGVGRNLPDFSGKTHCDFCHLKSTCNMKTFGEKC